MLSFEFKFSFFDTRVQPPLVPQDIFSEHYGEDPSLYSEEIADLCDLRNSTRTPSRNQHGVSLLLEYYNQLYFIEHRFYFPVQPSYAVYFHW